MFVVLPPYVALTLSALVIVRNRLRTLLLCMGGIGGGSFGQGEGEPSAPATDFIELELSRRGLQYIVVYLYRLPHDSFNPSS